MSFRKLQDDLLNILRDRVRNGEITERRLAKMMGISQPHMHNVLKGVRELTPELSDRILKEHRLTIRDLLGNAASQQDRGVPVIQNPVGPGYPFPSESYCGIYPFPEELRAGLKHPAVFCADRDEQMEPEIMDRDTLLVDRCPDRRRTPDPHFLFVVSMEGCGFVRYVRRDGVQVYFGTSKNRHIPENWQQADLDGRDILEVIRGRVVWIGRQMEAQVGPVDQTGPAPGPAGGTGR